MDIDQIKVGSFEVFCYLIVCPRAKEALVIDPAGDEEKIVNMINEKGCKLRYIINTHGHADHICGNAKVQELTGAEIIMHKDDVAIFTGPKGAAMAQQWGLAPSPPVDRAVVDGDKIEMGDITLEVLHTPGHSPGGICLLGDGHVFTGDTLFVGAIGRTDLPGASMSQFMHSIKERLLILPGDTVVWPGHNYGIRPNSTIDIEKKTNPFLT